MIYTLTLNPAIDYVVRLPVLREGETNRAVSAEVQFGGKGINVSCVLRELGTDSTALGFAAGFTGDAGRGAPKFSEAIIVLGLGEMILPHLPPPMRAISNLVRERLSLHPQIIAIGAIVITATSINTPMAVNIIADKARARNINRWPNALMML